MATAKHVVKLCDMPPDMEQGACLSAKQRRRHSAPLSIPCSHLQHSFSRAPPRGADAVSTSLDAMGRFDTEKEVAHLEGGNEWH